jgi:actin-related protein
MANPNAAAKSASASPPKKRRRAPPSSSSRSKKKATSTEKQQPGVRVLAAPTHTLILDNGGDTLKYGWATEDKPQRIANVTARLIHQFTVLVGDELSRVQNPNNLIAVTRSTERGIICNLGNQTQVWKRILDLLGVMINVNSEAASALGWKVGGRTTNSNTNTATNTQLPPKSIPAHSIAVVLLLPPHCPRLLLDQITYVWMEDFGVSHIGFGISSVCAAEEHPKWKSSCSIDLGWSSSLIVPTFEGKPVQASAIRRVPIGGRHLINMLKYFMSYRQYNLMDQESILRDVLEQLAYFSMDFKGELRLARYHLSGRRPYDRDYVLPDYQMTHQGKIRLPHALQKQLEQEKEGKSNSDDEEEDDDDDDEDFDEGSGDGSGDEDGTNQEGSGNDDNEEDDEEEESQEQKRKRLVQQRAEDERRRREQEQEVQILRVSVERFAIPEVLFRPRDAALPADLVGLAQAVVQSIQACPKAYHPALYQTVHVTGGLSQLPNLKPRLEQELRTLVPAEYELKSELAESPIDQAWLGAKKWIQQAPYTKWSVSREEWESAGKRRAYARLLMGNGGVYA